MATALSSSQAHTYAHAQHQSHQFETSKRAPHSGRLRTSCRLHEPMRCCPCARTRNQSHDYGMNLSRVWVSKATTKLESSRALRHARTHNIKITTSAWTYEGAVRNIFQNTRISVPEHRHGVRRMRPIPGRTNLRTPLVSFGCEPAEHVDANP